MIVETPEQLEKIFLEVKLAFPEVRPLLQTFPTGKYQNCSMGADVYFTGNIFWRKSILGDYSSKIIEGMLAHEFGHLVNQKYMGEFNSEQIAEDKKRYRFCKEYRMKIEKGADKTAISRGWGKELYTLISTFRLDEDWKNKWAWEHLSLSEIIELMKEN